MILSKAIDFALYSRAPIGLFQIWEPTNILTSGYDTVLSVKTSIQRCLPCRISNNFSYEFVVAVIINNTVLWFLVIVQLDAQILFNVFIYL